MFNALTDCETAALEDTKQTTGRMYKVLKDKLIKPLCQDIETNLRLQIHSHLQMTKISPFQQAVVEDQMLHSQFPIRYVDHYISVKSKQHRKTSCGILSVEIQIIVIGFYCMN